MHMAVFFEANLMVIDFAYGLVFFVMGVVCYLAGRTFRTSRLALAQVLPWLAAFGLLVGLAVWGAVFIPLQAAYLSQPWLDRLSLLQSVVLLAGYASLGGVGLRLPALAREHRELARFYPRPARWLIVAAWAFILSVPLGPLALPATGRAPCVLWGVPLQALLAAGGFVLALSLFAGLEALRLENSLRLERAERREALLEGRYRLAKELNDGVIQDLFAVGMMVGAAAWDVPDAARAPLAAAERQLQAAVERMRSYIMDLDPVDWSEPNLAVGVGRIVDEFQANSLIPATVEVTEAGSLPAAEARELYTVLHEALSNVRRHSGARLVHITLRRHAQGLALGVEDDGVGFDYEATRGSGLERMERSAGALQGRLSIGPHTKGGTRVLLELPSASMVSHGS